MQLRHDMLVHGVYIITARYEDRLGGLAVAWGMQVGTDSFLICVGQQSATRELILASGAFGLNVLRVDQVAVGNWFGRQSSRSVAKFEGIAWSVGAGGVPILEDCGTAFSCQVTQVFDRGNQKLIVGQIAQVDQAPAAFTPLVYREEDYPADSPRHPYL